MLVDLLAIPGVKIIQAKEVVNDVSLTGEKLLAVYVDFYKFIGSSNKLSEESKRILIKLEFLDQMGNLTAGIIHKQSLSFDKKYVEELSNQ